MKYVFYLFLVNFFVRIWDKEIVVFFFFFLMIGFMVLLLINNFLLYLVLCELYKKNF